MKIDMKRKKQIGIIIIILVVEVILLAYLATTFAPTPIYEPRRPYTPYNLTYLDENWYYAGDIELFYIVKTVLSTINATLLIFLMVIYIDLYNKLKSEFTIGLLIFSMILLLYALVSNPILQNIFGFRGIGLGPFAMLPDLFTCLALVLLLYLTLK